MRIQKSTNKGYFIRKGLFGADSVFAIKRKPAYSDTIVRVSFFSEKNNMLTELPR
ncbi:MAG: hypothetical protein JJU02_07335 [Cryomorphaceae bacterium]|nr:hypothetical protein [Cryomorphaceae bacterium]